MFRMLENDVVDLSLVRTVHLKSTLMGESVLWSRASLMLSSSNDGAACSSSC